MKKVSIPVPLVHLVAWLLYGVFIFIANSLAKPNGSFIGAIAFLVPFVLSFYANIYCLKLFKKKGVFVGVVSLLLVVFVIGAFGYLYVYFFLPTAGVKIYASTGFNHFLKSAMLGHIQFFTLSLMYFYASESVLKEKQLREIQMEKFEADQLRIKNELENSILREKELINHKERLQLEYAFLRAQINPHFLHNTLNVLFSQALDSSPSLPDNILKLSKLMRYAIESLENENGCVSIEKEVEHLKTLLEIHQLRVGKEQVISFEVNGGFQGQLLPPLSVITIVENAFKYGDLSDSAHPLKIVLSLTSTRVTFLCSNKKSSQSLIIPSNNIGMTNLRKRLDVVFKGRYNMNIIDDSKFFTFEMSIDQ